MKTTGKSRNKTIGFLNTVSIFIIINFCFLAWIHQTDASTIKLSVIYNNIPFDSRLENDLGYSCLIEGIGKTILFDTGGYHSILQNNMKVMGIKPKIVNSIFLSHYHYDHTGGLENFLKHNSNVNVYVLESFPEWYIKMIQDSGAKTRIMTNFAKLSDLAYSTGKMNPDKSSLIKEKEQSLIIETSEGLVILVGCGHNGIVNIVRKSRESLNDEVLLIMGGFHLTNKNTQEIETIINELKKLGVKKVAPSHCTGEEAISLFRNAWGNNYLESGTGAIIEVPK